MNKPDQVITLANNSQLTVKIVDNENGVLVQLVTASEAKTVDATLMWTPYGEDRVTFINRKPLLEYRCTDCQTEFTNEEAGNYCSECGHDEVMYIPDLEEAT
jgi:Zn finger protein HypA/HybF involved in hydrogenase expression